MKALQFNLSVPKYLALQALGRIAGRFYYDGPFATVRLVDVPEPDLPGRDWVRIKTRLCGFCGSDMNLIQVKDSPMASPFTSFPCIFGHEVCGEVVEADPGLENCKVGDLATVNPGLNCAVRGFEDECAACRSGHPANCERMAEGALSPGMFIGICKDVNGGFAEYLVAHKSQIYRIPEGVSPESGMLTEPLAVAVQAVMENRPANGDKVLVIGGGVIGSMVVKVIRGLDIACSISVSEPSAFHAGFAKRIGADHVFSGGILDAAEKITGGKAYKPMLGQRILQGGFDKVFDTVGHSPTLQTALLVAAAGATVSLVGIGKKLSFDPTPLWLKLQTLKGCYGYGFHDAENGRKHAFEIALDLMESKKVQVEDMLTHTFTIEQYKKLIDVNMHKGRNKAIKTAFRF